MKRRKKRTVDKNSEKYRKKLRSMRSLRRHKGKKLNGLSRTKCMGGDHFLTKQQVKDGDHLCRACLARNATYAPNAEGVPVPTKSTPEHPDY